jgi:RNA polymerase sigma factor (sigma-70 family)
MPEHRPFAVDDSSLLRAWSAQRDESAFRSLCERHAALVRATCRRLRSPDADEAAQAVFIVLAQRAHAVADGARLAGWLVGTARRVVAHQRRAEARRRRHEQEAAMDQLRQHRDQQPDPAWAEARQLLDEALDSLGPKRREALVRFYLQGTPQVEVAAQLGCSVDAVKTRVHEGLEKLRTYFIRRGVAIGAAALASGLAGEAATAEPALAGACAEAGLAPATVPAAATIASGAITAMITKTATVTTAAAIAAGLCLTTALVLGAEAVPVPPPPRAAPSQVAAVAPDPGRNAALDWWRGFEFLPKDDDPIWRMATSPQGLPDPAADALFVHPVRGLDLLALGATRGYCDWGIEVEREGAAALLPYLGHMRKAIRLGGLRARWHALRGEHAAAVADALACLRAARIYAGRRPLVIDVLAGYSMERSAMGVAGAVAPRLDGASRRELAAALAGLPAPAIAAAAMDQEIAMADAEVRRLRTLPSSERGAAVSALSSTSQPQGPAAATELAAMAAATTDAGLERFLALYPVEIARQRAHLLDPLSARCRPLVPRYSSGDQPPQLLLGLFFPAVEQLAATEVRMLIQREQLAAALACLDEGDAALARHPDPVTGKPFRIERTATGFRLSATLPEQQPIEFVVGDAPRPAATQAEPAAQGVVGAPDF